MRFAETIKLAIAAIWAHPLRSFLTLLGMIIGMTAFMVVLSLLQGFNSYVDEKIAGIGSNTFNVQRFNFDDFKDTDTLAEAQRRNKELNFDELDFVRDNAQTLERIAAKAGNTSRTIRRGSTVIEDVSITGAEPEIREIENLDMRQALKLALERERDSESHYRFMAERVPNTELGRLFMELAEIEWKHKTDLQSEYDAVLSKDPEQFLFDL